MRVEEGWHRRAGESGQLRRLGMPGQADQAITEQWIGEDMRAFHLHQERSVTDVGDSGGIAAHSQRDRLALF